MAKVAALVVLNLLFISLWIISDASAFEFRAGGSRGWMRLTGEGSETYSHWDRRNRFHTRDSLFQCSNDSVLVVDREDFVNCSTTNPLLDFTDGNTTFWFSRQGYFVSGEPEHCESGQKLIGRVMVHPFVNPGPGPAPAPMPGGGSGSHSGPASAPWSSSASALNFAAAAC